MPKKKSLGPLLLWALVPVIALAGAFVLVTGLSGKAPVVASAVQSATPTIQAPRLNEHGVPLSCSDPALTALVNDILVEQQALKGEITTISSGYSMSFVDAQNSESQPAETSLPSEYKHLTCSYNGEFDSENNYSKSLTFDFDSVSQPRSWMADISEQELKLGLGEKLVIYYADGSGYEWGGGLTWRLWVADGYMQVDTWNAAGNGYAILKPELIGNVISLLNGK